MRMITSGGLDSLRGVCGAHHWQRYVDDPPRKMAPLCIQFNLVALISPQSYRRLICYLVLPELVIVFGARDHGPHIWDC